MIIAISNESRGESYEGKLAVGYVIMNRLRDKEFPKSICNIVYQKHQFSYIHKHKVPNQLKGHLTDISFKVLSNSAPNPIGKRKYFNTVSLGIRNKTKYKPIIIGNHIFY